MSGITNEASWDRIARVVGGALLIFLGFGSAIGGALGVVAGLAGVVFLVTGLIGWCPIYAALKVRTNKELV